MPIRPAQPLSKEETTILKGVAILNMIFYHLFNIPDIIEKYGICDWEIAGQTLSFYIAKFRLCVPMYLFLSGYGLYISWQKNKHMRPLRRTLLLYLNFWIIFAVFIGLACWLKPSVYPGSFETLIINLTGWSATYNNHWWFLLPYIGLVFLSPLIFPLIRRYNALLVFLSSGLIFLASYSTIKFNQDFLIHHYLLYNPLLIVNCSFAFITCALCAKIDAFRTFSSALRQEGYAHRRVTQLSLLLLIALLFVAQAILPVSIFGVAFSFIFIFAFINLNRPAWCDWFLTLMGKQSTNMWLIHGFFCCFLFSSFIYSFKYPLLIFVITLAFSYVSGILIDLVYKPLRKVVMSATT